MAVRVEAKKSESIVFTPRFVIRVVVAGVALVALIYGWNRTEQFLIHDPRFAVALPDYGVESPSLRIAGAHHVSRLQLLHIFSPDYGRSIYMTPLKERREQLREIDWVKDASVARLWPNLLVVQIQEREPVAFLNVPDRSGVSRFLLIDNDGMILKPPQHARFTLPVALGIAPNSAPPERESRIHRLTYLMRDVGSLGDRVSEVDVTDPDNLKATVRVQNRVAQLVLGDQNFKKRLENFFNNYDKIEDRLVNASMVDMRLEDRITVVEGNGGAK